MAHSWRSKTAVFMAVSLLLFSAIRSAEASGNCVVSKNGVAPDSQVNAAISSFGSRVIAVGRVDAVSRNAGVEVLGIRVMPSASDSFQVGDYAVVVDWSRRQSAERLLEIRSVSGRYIPGVSEIFLRSKLSAGDTLLNQGRVGAISVDFSNSAYLSNVKIAAGVDLAIRGTQPQPDGVVLSSCVSLARDGSLGTGKTNGSLGTGWTSGSLGTGKTNGSLGTGWTSGSLGTGKTDGSLGTGRLSGSLGTGRTEGSLGTGKTNGSLGTGWTSGSLGTGKTDGSLGTGRAQD
jgi:hypothetical protein